MNKGLEALENIKKEHIFIDFELDFDIGEQYKDEFNIVEKELKALEIIKNRAEDEQFGLLCLEKEPSGRYCLTIDTHIRTLTKEEYDLLKEVLL